MLGTDILKAGGQMMKSSNKYTADIQQTLR